MKRRLDALRALIHRPLGEWLFLALLLALGVNSLYNGLTADAFGAWEQAVRAGNGIIGAAAIGIATAIVVRRRWGLSLLWLCSLAMIFTGCAATWKLGGAPVTTVLGTAMLLAFVSALLIWYGSRRLHAAVTQQMWPALVDEHVTAVEEYVGSIAAMSGPAWTARRAPDAWSAAEITEHLVRTYAQFAGEARGKNSLRVRVAPVRRLLIRLFVKRRLLAGEIAPRARAPRELRPTGGPATPADGVVMFRAASDGCLRDLEVLAKRRPFFRLVHPYFGALPLYEIMQFSTQHIRHHRRQLPT